MGMAVSQQNFTKADGWTMAIVCQPLFKKNMHVLLLTIQ